MRGRSCRGWRRLGHGSRNPSRRGTSRNIIRMEGADPFGGLFAAIPTSCAQRLGEMAEQMQSSQKVAWADNAIKLAVEMTVAAINRLDLAGLERRAGGPGARRDPDRLPRGRDTRARGARGPFLSRHTDDLAHVLAARLASACVKSRRRRQRGAASVEHVGLALLIALLMLGAVAALATGPPIEKGRELGTSLARKLRCAPRLPGPCWRDPLTEAYGRPLAGLVRALAPRPRAVAAPSGRATRAGRLPLLPPRELRYAGRAAGADGVESPRDRVRLGG